MKTKVAIGLVVAICVLGVGYLALQPRTASSPVEIPTDEHTATTTPTPTPAAAVTPSVTNNSASSIAKPTITTGPVTTKTEPAVAQFADTNMVTTENYPTFGGTANVPRVAIIIYNSDGAGLVSTDQIMVENGRWSYNTSIMLPPDTYTIELYGGAKVVKTTLEVK